LSSTEGITELKDIFVLFRNYYKSLNLDGRIHVHVFVPN